MRGFRKQRSRMKQCLLWQNELSVKFPRCRRCPQVKWPPSLSSNAVHRIYAKRRSQWWTWLAHFHHRTKPFPNKALPRGLYFFLWSLQPKSLPWMKPKRTYPSPALKVPVVVTVVIWWRTIRPKDGSFRIYIQVRWSTKQTKLAGLLKSCHDFNSLHNTVTP